MLGVLASGRPMEELLVVSKTCGRMVPVGGATLLVARVLSSDPPNRLTSSSIDISSSGLGMDDWPNSNTPLMLGEKLLF